MGNTNSNTISDNNNEQPNFIRQPEAIPGLSLQDIAKNYKVIKLGCILDLPKIPRLQDIPSEFFEWNEPPMLIIFISHRWESKNHPDPNTKQLNTVKQFFGILQDLVGSLNSKDRIAIVKSLKVYGYPQAAYILSCCKDKSTAIQDRIGIWYDYMCLPQINENGEDDRTKEEQCWFDKQLGMLPTLLSSCNIVLSLRKDNDDYNDRAWCCSEICYDSKLRKDGMSNIVLRTDIPIGSEISDSLLLPEELEGYEIEWVQDIWKHLSKWEENLENAHGVLNLIHYYYANFAIAEEKRTIPLFTTPRPPILFPKQKDVIMMARSMLMKGNELDVGTIVRTVLHACEIKCTDGNDKDLTLCGLLILLARHSGHPTWASFFSECISRFIDGQHLLLESNIVWESSSQGGWTMHYNHPIHYKFKL